MPPVIIAAGIGAAGSIAASAIAKGGKPSGPTQDDVDRSNKAHSQNLVNDALGFARDYSQQLAAQPGISNQQSVFQQAQGLANQYGQIAQGEGPNPAQAMLAQATGNNIASQAALMAGQRGANTNVGLIGRQAAQQGAGIQQQAIGQGATLQAQQQLAAMQGQAQQQQLQGGIAQNQVSQGLQGQQMFGQLALGNQGNLLGRQNAMDSVNAKLSNAQSERDAKLVGGVASGIGSAFGALSGGVGSAPAGAGASASSAWKSPAAMAEGGEVSSLPSDVDEGPCTSASGKFLYKAMRNGGKVPGKAEVRGDSPKNDKVPTMLSPGEIVVPRSAANDPEKAAAFARAVAMKARNKGR